MIAKSSGHLRARLMSSLAAVCVLATLLPAGALAASSTTYKTLGVTIPASAGVHTAATTTTPATSIPASPRVPGTTPTATTTRTSAPAGTVQPGTVVPPTTTPAGATTQTAGTPTSTATPKTGSTTVVVARKGKPHSKGLSALALALAILGALLVLGCIAWALGRWLALEPRWSVAFMHSLREAAYRASETWAEFGDWARLGR